MIEHNGKNYARVSDILRPFTNFKGIDEQVLERKKQIGIRVHKAIEKDIKNEIPEIDNEIEPYFKSYQLWKERIAPIFLQSEQRYFSDNYMITGQIDTIIETENPYGSQLVDFKTSAEESKETWPMQAHLYNVILADNSMFLLPMFNFVKLDKEGKLPKVFTYSWSTNTFLKCKKAIEDFWNNYQNLGQNGCQKLSFFDMFES